MSTKFPEGRVPLTDMKINSGRIAKQFAVAHRPVLFTSRGRGVAVVQSLEDFKKGEEERVFMRALVQGFSGLETGRKVGLDEALFRLGLK